MDNLAPSLVEISTQKNVFITVTPKWDMSQGSIDSVWPPEKCAEKKLLPFNNCKSNKQKNIRKKKILKEKNVCNKKVSLLPEIYFDSLSV